MATLITHSSCIAADPGQSPSNSMSQTNVFDFLKAKPFFIAVSLVLFGMFFSNTTFAGNKKVKGVTFGAQSGTAYSGTANSVTYTLTLSESGGSGVTADNLALTWASGTPTGVTYAFSSSTETPITSTSFTPSGTNNSTITLTITTTNGTPANSYGFTVVVTDNNGGGGPYTSSGMALLVSGLSYSGPYTYYAGSAIATITPAVYGTAPLLISGTLPAGLTLNTLNGQITGTPTAVSAATNYTISATYLLAGPSSATVNITILANTISYSPSTFSYYAGNTIAAQTPSYTGAPTSFSGTLPAGLTLNTSTGQISGTPTTPTAAANYTITANYNGGVTAQTTVNIAVLANTFSYTGSPFTYTTTVAISTLTPSYSGTPVSFSGALPAGLSLNTTNGQITGTPTAPSAATNYTITANYASSVTAVTTINITVNLAPPVISYSPSTNSYPTGSAITALIPTNTGGTVASYSISAALPAGLSFNTTTGVISGTPTTVTATTTYTITAHNAGGTGTANVTITITPAPPVISYSPSSKVYPVNTAITPYSPTNTGGVATSWSISTALPTGLSFSTTTGVISGTPTVASGNTTYTITATNAGGSGSTTVNITIAPPAPIISYSPSSNTFTVGTAITPWTPTNTGGADTIYAVGPSLPAGLSFNTTTGTISGTPTATSPSTVYTISGTNDGGTSTTSVTIACTSPVPPAISYTPSTNTYTVGTAISTLTPTNTGGLATSYAINTALPAGLSFNTSTGAISGTPTAVSATTTYTVTATNSNGSGTANVTITVNPSAPVISYSPSTVVFSTGTAISPMTPINTGGTPSSYSISAALPAGLSFSTTTGVISGTPTTTFSATTYTITATNATGSGSTTVTLSAGAGAPNIVYSPGTVSYPVGSTITPATPTNSGGVAASWSISGTLPSGLTFNTSTGVISGAPTVVFPTTTFTITATNTHGSSSTNLIITVGPAAPIIAYTPNTQSYPVGAAIATWAPTNTGGAVTGYAYATTGTQLTGATLSGPSLMTIDASGNIYVANYSNKTISRWNSAHTYLGTYTTGKTLTNPEGIVFDSAGNSYVEDTGAGAIYKFGPTGAYISTIITGLNHPLGISIDASNNLYIATYVYTSPYTSSVAEYTTAGVLESSLPNTNMNESDGVAVDQSSGIIYVLNRGNNLTGSNQGYVSYYNSAGTYLGTFSSGYSDPLAISVDPSGNVFVADSHNDEVKIYSSTGVLLNTLTGFTDVEGFVADASGNLYVSDFTDNTVKEYLSLGGYHISAPLPTGLVFNSTTGAITGTPTVPYPTTTYTVTAYNVTGSGQTQITLSCYTAYDWIGKTSTDWNTPSNWLSNVVPTSANTANIGVNVTFNYFPNVLATDGTVNVGAIAFGNVGSQAPGVVVNTGGTLNVAGAMTYQSDASAGLGYTCTLSGGGSINTATINVIANTTLSSSYTATFASSNTDLDVSGNISLTSSNSGSSLYNATFNVTGGQTELDGVVQTSNTSTSTSAFAVVPTTSSTATLLVTSTTFLSGLSTTGINTVSFRNAGATVNYGGAAQTVYDGASISGLSTGVTYQSIAFSGTGIMAAPSGNIHIGGDFTNTMANDAADYVKLSASGVYFDGTTQNLAAGGGNGQTFYNVTFSGAGTKTMVSGNFYINNTSSLTMGGNSTSTILNANGNLTLLSKSTGSASIAAIPTGPSITGTVNVQRYLSGGSGYRGYRLGSSPVYAATVGSLNVCSINYLQNSMYLSGSAGGGFDKVGNPSLYLFREDQTPNNTGFSTGNWWGINAINNTPAYNYAASGLSASGTFNIPVGDGYLFFFRGNRASASLATETTPAYTTPTTVTATTSGTLNQGQVTVSDWYTPTSQYLGYTGTGTATNYAVRGFNLVGNPYASSIDWESYNTTSTTTGIYASNVGTSIYEYNDVTHNYAVYQKGGIYTNYGKRTIVSGQAFFVQAVSSSNPQLIFNESAKTTSQNTGLYLFMSTQQDIVQLQNNGVNPHIRLQIAADSINTDDLYIGFDQGSSSKYVDNEDVPYKQGEGLVSLASFSSDSVRLAVNKMALPTTQQQVIPLSVNAQVNGTYTMNMTEIDAIPNLYEVWLMDKFNKDSLDMRNNPTYRFDITADTNSHGRNRFQLVIRENPAMMVHLLSFDATKAVAGSQVVWITENEQNYTNFTVERSTDNGASYSVLSGVASNAQGTYSFLDTNPQAGADMYRLKIVDINGTISYSNVVTLMYGDASSLVKTGIVVYPNPAKSTLNLSIKTGFNAGTSTISISNAAQGSSYNVQIASVLGSIVKKTTINQQNWQTDVSALTPGTYIIQVINKNTAAVVGEETFVKL